MWTFFPPSSFLDEPFFRGRFFLVDLFSVDHFSDLQSANPLSNAEAKSKADSMRSLQTSPIFNWLP